MIENGQRLSNTFSTLNYRSSFYLNMYDSTWNENLYYSREIRYVDCFTIENQKLKLYGVFAPVLPILDELCRKSLGI